MQNNNVPREAIMMCNKFPGKALPGYFASTAWLKSQEEFEQITGSSFGWFDFADGVEYKNDKRDVRLMTPEEWAEHKHLFEEHIFKIDVTKKASVMHHKLLTFREVHKLKPNSRLTCIEVYEDGKEGKPFHTSFQTLQKVIMKFEQEED